MRKLIPVVVLLAAASFIFHVATTPSMPKAKIVFSADADGSDDIYVTRLGGGRITLIRDELNSGPKILMFNEPSFSGDGAEIVFVRKSFDRRGNTEHIAWDKDALCVMKSDGSNVRVLKEGDGLAVPFFSPERKAIVFKEQTGRDFRMMLLKIESGLLEVLHNDIGQCIFSPDGKNLLNNFSCDLSLSGTDSIQTRQLSELLLLERTQIATKRKRVITSFDFSDDGGKIAFVLKETFKDARQRFSTVLKLYCVNADGSRLEEVGEINCADPKPPYINPGQSHGKFGSIKRIRFSKDARSLLFLLDLNYKQGIFALDLANKSVRELTPSDNRWRQIMDFSLSPDGKTIAFVADVYPFNNPRLLGYAVALHNLSFQKTFYDNKYVFVMNADGSNPRRGGRLPLGTKLGRNFIHWE